MMDHNILKEEIVGANRYLKLQDLRVTISGLKRGLPISISTELNGRITEKLRTFDYPICSVAKVRVIFTNGLSKDLDPEECNYAMSRGMKLSDYIFSHYPSARDFEIEPTSYLGSRNQGVYTDGFDEDPYVRKTSTPISNAALDEKLDFLLQRVENLERLETVYAENIPKLTRDVNDIKDKLDWLYRRILGR